MEAVKKHFVRLAGILCLLTTISPVAAADSASSPNQVFRAALDAYNGGDCAKAVSLVTPLMKGGPAVSGSHQANAYDLAITCALKDQDLARAGDYARRATALPDGSAFAWRIRFAADAETKHYGAAIDTLEAMMRGNGKALNALRPVWLWRMRRALVRAGDEANDIRLLKIIADPAYDPDDLKAKVEDTGDVARALYARKLLKAGQRDAARAQLDGLQGFRALSDVAFDRDLLALRDKPIDLHAAVENDLVRHRAMVVRYPRWLGAINAVAVDLFRLGRNDESIALLKATLSRLNSNDAFDDQSEALPWFWNAMAYSYEATGQYDAMVAAFAKGAAAPEEGGTSNVSQFINLAANQVEFGRGKEALATLAKMGDKPQASPYGLMQIRIVRGCAQAALGQIDKARAELDYAVAHPDDDPAAVTSLSLCVGDLDRAAASYVARLGNADTRLLAVLELAEYDPRDPRAPVGPAEPALDQVRKRSDIVAAVRAAGGPFRIHLQRDPF